LIARALYEIDWFEMEEALERLGYRRHVPKEWSEFAFVKLDRGANLGIVVATGFDINRHRREPGQNSIRAMLGTMVPVKLPVLALKTVRSYWKWKDDLERQIGLLERIVADSPNCPDCHGSMLPQIRRDRSGAFWGCGHYAVDGCRGKLPMKDTLVYRLLEELPTPRDH